MTAGCWPKPGADATIPNTRSHARTRSRSPNSRLRLPRIASVVSRAAIAFIDGKLASQLPQRPGDRTIDVLRPMAGDEHARATHADEGEGQPNPGRRHNRSRQRES